MSFRLCIVCQQTFFLLVRVFVLDRPSSWPDQREWYDIACLRRNLFVRGATIIEPALHCLGLRNHVPKAVIWKVYFPSVFLHERSRRGIARHAPLLIIAIVDHLIAASCVWSLPWWWRSYQRPWFGSRPFRVHDMARFC